MPLFTSETPALAVRGIHLDLKGLPPTAERLLQLPELLAACKINCVLVEWEDTYPWHCYEELRCETAYSDEVVASILAACATCGIEVIPLLQSFGHMQNVLVRERFAHLSEIEGATGDLCPSKAEAVPLIIEMIDDILMSHGGIKRLHLGGDEVWSLGTCDECKTAVGEIGKDGLYLKHVRPLLDHVVSHGVRPILWDDMMREWPEEALSKLGAKTDLMCWAYRSNPFENVTREIMDRFDRAGVKMWAGSAFKGADGLSVDVCEPAPRLANLDAWAKEASARGMVGAVATGWSRYSTFAVPCEGLESSLDFVVAAGSSMWDGHLNGITGSEVDEFLTGGALAGAAGERFVACRAASRELAKWRGDEWPLENLLDNAAICGEVDRLDRAGMRKALEKLREYIARGEELCGAWWRAHSGLVEEVWLERYCDARMCFAKSVLAPWLDCVESELKGRL